MVTWRYLKRIPRIPELAIFAILQSIMFVLLFTIVFGGAIPLSEYLSAQAKGDTIGAEVAAGSPLTPEFMTSLVVFDAGLQLGERALKPVVPGGGVALLRSQNALDNLAVVRQLLGRLS